MIRTDICDRCEKPLSQRYWMTIFHEDGRIERAFRGKPPPDLGPAVVVNIDMRCSKGRKGKVKYDDWAEVIPEAAPVGPENRSYTLDDLMVLTEGKRILMVMPKKLVAIA